MSERDVSKIQEELDLIEDEVSRGNYALKELGFWKIVAKVKRDAVLIDRFADQIGRIDRRVFKEKAWLKINTWIGNAFEIAGTMIGLGLLVFGIVYPTEFFRGVAIVIASFILSGTLHPLAHYVVGRLVGIRFLFYFPDGPVKIEPSIKIDYATYLHTPPKHRAVMHLAGPVATVVSAFACLIIGLIAGLPSWAIYILTFYFLLLFLTDIFFSPKAGDLKRVLREWRVHKQSCGSG